ncbi:MAG: hypothetical protein U1E65_30770 [Myxococcota bacterium]
MRALRFAPLLVLGACLNGASPVQPPPPVVACIPAEEGFGDATAYSEREYSLPAGCHILDDDGSVAVHRRQVEAITTAQELSAACADHGPSISDAGVPGTPGAAPIDFSTEELLVVRIPDTTHQRWIMRRADVYTVGESTTACTGVLPHAVKYLVLLPKTATVAFHLCVPEGCSDSE